MTDWKKRAKALERALGETNLEIGEAKAEAYGWKGEAGALKESLDHEVNVSERLRAQVRQLRAERDAAEIRESVTHDVLGDLRVLVGLDRDDTDGALGIAVQTLDEDRVAWRKRAQNAEAKLLTTPALEREVEDLRAALEAEQACVEELEERIDQAGTLEYRQLEEARDSWMRGSIENHQRANAAETRAASWWEAAKDRCRYANGLLSRAQKAETRHQELWDQLNDEHTARQAAEKRAEKAEADLRESEIVVRVLRCRAEGAERRLADTAAERNEWKSWALGGLATSLQQASDGDVRDVDEVEKECTFRDLDAAGNCRCGCGYNSDDHYYDNGGAEETAEYMRDAEDEIDAAKVAEALKTPDDTVPFERRTAPDVGSLRNEVSTLRDEVAHMDGVLTLLAEGFRQAVTGEGAE